MIDEIAPIDCNAESYTFTLLAQDTAGFLGHGGLGTQKGGSRVLVSR
jgi:hypothetical protein